MLNVAICGATGYTGLEIIKILLKHPKVKIKVLAAKIDKPAKISEIFPELKGACDLPCSAELIVNDVLKTKIDLLFLALPHVVSMEYVPRFMERGKRVIDLSADFRIKDPEVYETYYGQKHIHEKYLASSVYGLPELYSKEIKKAKLIANPGCYPTGAILALAPLLSSRLADTNSIIIDAKSGVTGAGRKAVLNLHFSEVNENIKPYKIGVHQHTPEIVQELNRLSKGKANVLFTPHLIPIDRGILTTCYIRVKKKVELKRLMDIYRLFYRQQPFIKIYNEGLLPQIRDVVNTNYCGIGMALSPDKKTAIIVSVIDNLQKGAGGQAVQNMNIMYGFPQTLGLV